MSYGEYVQRKIDQFRKEYGLTDREVQGLKEAYVRSNNEAKRCSLRKMR